MTSPPDDPKAVLRVAALQLSSQEHLAQNLERVDALVARAAKAGAELVVLPENFAYMGTGEGRCRIAERLGDVNAPIQSAIGRLAQRERFAIVAGGFPELSTDPERPFNTSACFAATGELLTVYRKIHLFDVDLRSAGSLCESRNMTAGKEVVVARVSGFGVGLSICYDVRFPELYRRLVDDGAEILTVPAAFTLYTGKDHWHVLLRARAIEAQCYVVAAAQWGRHPEGRTTFGHALIADPWGTVVAEASDQIGFALATIDREFLHEVRSRVPSLAHRRL